LLQIPNFNLQEWGGNKSTNGTLW